MKLRVLVIPGTVVAMAASCSPREGAPRASTSDLTAGHAPTLGEMVALRAVTRRSAARAAEPFTGQLVLQDDQLRNNHYASAYVTSGPRYDVRCNETLLDEGDLKCVKVKYCPASDDSDDDAGSGGSTDPGFPGLVDIGTIDIAATYDRIRLESRASKGGYGGESRPGPFWDGDGDEVTVSVAGKEGVVEPFTHRMPAPLPDVLARYPESGDRGQPFELSWRYAEGAKAPTGFMTVEITSFGNPGDSMDSPPENPSIMCGVPAAKGALRIPPSVLRVLSAGNASVRLSSTLPDQRVVTGKLVFEIDLTARVAVEGSDPNSPFGSIITLR